MPSRRESLLDSVEAVRAEHGELLYSLVGKRIEATWVAWDKAEDEWFSEEPVILLIGQTNLEVVFGYLDRLALSVDTIDLEATPDWWCDWGETEFELEWRQDALPELRGAAGRRIDRVRLVEYRFETETIVDRLRPTNVGRKEVSWLLHGLELGLDQGALTIYNALDENGISGDLLRGAEFRTFEVG